MPITPQKPPFGLSPALPSFDRATRLAKTLFAADQAFIVLVEDERVWRSIDPAGRLPQRHPVIDHVMRSGELLWLEDALQDPRFNPDNFIIGNFRTGFYGAAPVRLADGSTPGVFVVLDRQPRRFDPVLAERLRDLAASVADECDRARAIEVIKRSGERLQLSLELADIRVADVDFERRRVETAGVSDDHLGQSLSYEDMTKSALRRVDARDREKVARAWERLVKHGEPYRPEYRSHNDAGEEIWLEASVRLFKNDRGEIVRYVSASRNITDRKHAELALLQAKEAAEAANRAKSTFLATMSHEIRTPLNGVLGMAQAMAMDDLAPAQRERLDVIRRSGEALLVILNDVLDLSKIEAGKLELESAEFDLEDLAQNVHDIFAPAAEAKDCRFDLAIEPAAAGVYLGDPTRIRQILCNLVSNALKFTEAGEVRLLIGAAPEGLEMRITDSGIGMSEGQIASLFSKFQQADASTTRRFGGTGLGLAICRELASLMGGSIFAESRLGEGSTFTVRLPLPRLGDPMVPTKADPVVVDAPRSAPAALRVLAAEDNPVNQLVLKALLQHIGVEPLVVENGQEAVAAWEAEDWDLILMDVQMPCMDGPTATRAIRDRERASGRAHTPIVALTANAMSHQVDEYLAAGMDGFVAKPIEVGALFAAIEGALAIGATATRAIG